MSIQAQNLVFNPLDEHLKSPAAYFLNDENGGFYSLRTHMGIGYKNATLHVQKWNGLFWINYPKIEVESYAKPEDNRMAMCLHNGQLHIAGTFLQKGLSTGGLLYFDGTKWSTVGGGIWGNYAIANEVDVADMVSFQNQLFVCGIFNSAGGKTVRNFAVYNGSNWNAVRTNNGRVGALLILSDTLYAGGNFDSVENVKTGNLAAYYNGSWHASASIPSAIIKLGQFKQGVIICSADSVRLLQSGKLGTLSNNWAIDILNIDQIAEFGNSIYISGNFEDKNKQVFHLIQWNGVQWKMWFPATQMGKIEGNKFPLCVTNSALFFGGSFSKISGTQTDFVVEIQPGSSWLKGIAYLDNNENCVFDLGDKLLPRMLLSLNKGEYYTTTNTNGEYSIPIKTGSTGNIEVFPSKGNSGGCHGNEQNYYQAFSDTQYSFDFPIILSPEAVPTTFDFKAAGGYKARHGYRNQYEIKVDANTNQYPIKVLLQFVNGILVTKSDLPWTRKGDTELEWTVYNDTTISLELLNNPLIIQAGDT
ncbi:MAG: hypothetical protein IT244_13495, partial [Bacteroidia bacterium]|nr:hypothetical protein [Bacteroidia bacterium]